MAFQALPEEERSSSADLQVRPPGNSHHTILLMRVVRAKIRLCQGIHTCPDCSVRTPHHVGTAFRKQHAQDCEW